MNYVPGPRTLIEGIRKVPPGHLLEWRRGKVRMERVVDAAGAARRGRMSLEAAKEELDGLLRDSVREHLVSDVPLGVWASGGLDSSAILHYAAQQSGGAAEDVFGFVRGAQFRREPVFPGDRADLRDGPSRVRFESGSGTAERDSRTSPITRMSRARTRGRCRCGSCRG